MSLRIIGPNYRLSNGQIVYVDILPSQKKQAQTMLNS